MTIPLYSWITAKIKIWSKDAANKGYKRVFLENLQEFVQKRTFKKLGVFHPHNSVGLSETISKSEHKDAHENMPSSFYSLKQAFKTLPIPFEDICMLDIGCGSGRVLTYGMMLAFKRVVGIDLDEKGIEKAIENCLQLQKKGYDTLFDIQVADATQLEIPAYINLIYLFNPFGGATLNKVCENIHAHCKKTGTPVYIIYCNPVYHDVFEKQPAFHKLHERFLKNSHRDMVLYKIHVTGN